MNPSDMRLLQAEMARERHIMLWTVYNRPKDHPEGYIARMFQVGPTTGPTDATIKGDLEEMRRTFTAAGLICLPRGEHDEAQIVECWL